MNIINTQSTQKRILFFSAHPDDEIAGAGGFIIKTLQQGGAAKLVLCIDPSEPRPDLNANDERNARLKEFSTVADALGASHSFLDFPHYPILSYDTILPCVKEIREFKPDIVLILQEDEYHTEHQLTARIVKRAVWHAGRSAFPEYGQAHKVKEIWESEGDRPMSNPNHFEDITNVIEKKKEILLSYGSQQSRKDLVSAVEGLNAFRGIMYKRGKFAESFKTSNFFYG